MPPINKIFNGKLNLDDNYARVLPQDYVDALNITRDAQGAGQDSVVTNINGNFKIVYTLPAGVNKAVGSKADALRNRVYYFVWNSEDNDVILIYDKNTDTITKLLENLTDTGGEDILQFDPSRKINHIDLIYRDEGDLLSWTDGNGTPKEINVQTILDGTYGTVQINFIEAAKRPALSPPACVYGSDATKTANALRRKLFMFSYAWKYDDFNVSTPSTFSKIPLPVGYYGSDNDIDSSTNNYIGITVETGDKNVTDIEIYMRNNIGDAWGDFVVIASLDKALLNIPDNATYQFLFYNDSVYPMPTQNFQYVDGVQVCPLFDWVPQLADVQCLPNGNVKSYGAITEGYDNYPVSDLDVTITAENVTNVPPDAEPPWLSYREVGDAHFIYYVHGSVPEGTVYRIGVNILPPGPGTTAWEYTSLPGDTIQDVVIGLYAAAGMWHEGYSVDNFTVTLPSGSNTLYLDVFPGTGGGAGSISTEKTWLWDCPYSFGIVYVDEQNRDMPGVTTFANPVDSDNDFVVITPPFSQDSGNAQTPVISAEINHLPPAGAVKYYWVRRRNGFGNFMFYETCDFYSENGYYYFCLANIDQYKTDHSQFIYSSAPVTSESRIRIVAGISGNLYTSDLWTQDYQILGVETKTLSGGSSPDDDRPFIKVLIPSVAPIPAYNANMLVMIYTPEINPTTSVDSVYWEWGEAYDIVDGYHMGMDQNQTADQPATFIWEEGDVYFHTRTMYNTILNAPYTSTDTVSIMDANWSDFFDSAVNDNGRAQAVEINARRQFNPVLQRFSEAYQSGTNINGLNRFYPENFDEYDRSWGNIVKEFIDRRYMYVFQELNTGIVPILTQIVRDTAGNPLEANSEQLLNKITYPYDKQFGMGNVPESFAYGKGAMYGIDSNKGIVWRLSQDGMIALSVLYKCNSFFVSKLAAYKATLNNGYAAAGGVYTGNPTAYGMFDSYTNKYIIALEEINRYDSEGNLIFHQEPYTLTFNETRDSAEGFESFVSYHPEMMSCLNNTLITFKDGALWSHSGGAYCNFYGVQYDAYITPVFNDSVLVKKTFEAITEESNVVWECPEITTNINSYGTTPQRSMLIPQNFKQLEGNYHAGILRDINSIRGLYNGDTMKGNYMVIQFRVREASGFVFLNLVNLKYILSYTTTH